MIMDTIGGYKMDDKQKVENIDKVVEYRLREMEAMNLPETHIEQIILNMIRDNKHIEAMMKKLKNLDKEAFKTHDEKLNLMCFMNVSIKLKSYIDTYIDLALNKMKD